MNKIELFEIIVFCNCITDHSKMTIDQNRFQNVNIEGKFDKAEYYFE